MMAKNDYIVFGVIALIIFIGGVQENGVEFSVEITNCSNWITGLIPNGTVEHYVNTSYYNENTTETVYQGYNYTEDLYYEGNVGCAQKDTTEFTIYDGKNYFSLEVYPDQFTYSWEGTVLIIKDLSRGGSYYDAHPNECTPGVPSWKYDYGKVNKPEITVCHEDNDQKVKDKVKLT